MNQTDIRFILEDQRRELAALLADTSIIPRDVPDLASRLRRPNILAIMGIRRSGKSTLARQLLEKNAYGHVNFDDERLAGVESGGLNDILAVLMQMHGGDLEYLLLDEIQNVKGWELFANRMRRTRRLVITGSNSNLLAGELATHLTGRYADYVLYPFSFGERLRFLGMSLDASDARTTEGTARLMSELENHLKGGGLPEVLHGEPGAVVRIFKDIVHKDAIGRFGVRNQRTFGDMARFLVANHANEVTYNRMRNLSGIRNHQTVKNYMEYLSTAYLVFFIERYSPRLTSAFMAPRKVYCTDNGMAYAMGGASTGRGRLMENLVAIELSRHILDSGPGASINYWKDHRGLEVDFVVRRGRDVSHLIQVCADVDDDRVWEREASAILAASIQLGCEKSASKTVITWDRRDTVEYEGATIERIPLYTWLLDGPLKTEKT